MRPALSAAAAKAWRPPGSASAAASTAAVGRVGLPSAPGLKAQKPVTRDPSRGSGKGAVLAGGGREGGQRRDRPLAHQRHPHRPDRSRLLPHALEQHHAAALAQRRREVRVALRVARGVEHEVERDGPRPRRRRVADRARQQPARPAAELGRQPQRLGRGVVLRDHRHPGRRLDRPAQPQHHDLPELALEEVPERARRPDHRQAGREPGRREQPPAPAPRPPPPHPDRDSHPVLR